MVRSPRRPSLTTLETAATMVFTAWVAWPFLRLDGYVTSYDVVTYAGPNAAFTADAFGAHRLPQWNDAIYGGTNFIANPQAGVFNPLKALTLVAGPARGLDLAAGLGLFVMAVGMLVLLRRLHLRPPAAGIGTIVVVGGGVMMARSTQPEQVAVLVWVPWLLAAIDVAVSTAGRGWRASARPVALVALATGAVLVAGHPQQVYLSLPLAAAWAVMRALDATATPADAPADPGGPVRWRAVAGRLGRVAGGVVLGIGVAAAQVISTALFLPQVAALSGRGIDAVQEGYSLRPELLGSALFGNPFAREQPTSSESFEAMAFVGAAALVLAVLGLGVCLAGRRRRATGIGLAVVVVAGTVAAMGPQCTNLGSDRSCDLGGSAYRVAARVLPGFSLARVPGRWMIVVTIALAILAAVALDALARRWVSRPALVATGVGLFVVAALFGLGRPELAAGQSAGTVAWWVLGAGVTLGLVLASARWPASARLATAAVVVPCVLIALDLGIANRHSVARAEFGPVAFTDLRSSTAAFLADQPGRIISRGPQPPDDLAMLSAALKPNTNVTQHVRSLDGYDGGVWLTKDWSTAVAGLTESGSVALELPLNWQMRDPIDPAAAAALGVRWVVVDGAKAATVVPGFRGPVHTDGDIQVWENPTWQGDAWTRTGGATAPVTLDRPSPETIRVRVTATAPTPLAVAEQPLPGWSATIDGAPVPIEAAPNDPLALVVAVPAGTHDVELTYATPGLRLGLLLSALSLAACAVLWVLGRGRPTGRSGIDSTTGRAIA